MTDNSTFQSLIPPKEVIEWLGVDTDTFSEFSYETIRTIARGIEWSAEFHQSAIDLEENINEELERHSKLNSE